MQRRNVFNIKNLKKDVVEELDLYLNKRQINNILILIATPNGLHEFLKRYERTEELKYRSSVKFILLDEILILNLSNSS